MIEEGDEATASDMIEAKYKAVNGKFESGIQGMEQAAVLDISAQLPSCVHKSRQLWGGGITEVCGDLKFIYANVMLPSIDLLS